MQGIFGRILPGNRLPALAAEHRAFAAVQSVIDLRGTRISMQSNMAYTVTHTIDHLTSRKTARPNSELMLFGPAARHHWAMPASCARPGGPFTKVGERCYASVSADRLALKSTVGLDMSHLIYRKISHSCKRSIFKRLFRRVQVILKQCQCSSILRLGF